MSINEARGAAIIATVAVVVGLADMPYGFYTLLRFALCCISVFLLFGAGLKLADWEKWALGAFAVLYNPIVPIRLADKDIWIVANVVTVVLIWVVALRPRPSS